MKFFKALATTLAVCAAFSGASVQARTIEAIQKDGTILLATEGQFAPFNYFKGSTLTGFEVEVAELVAKKMGLKIKWKTIGFDALLTGLKQDRWDLVIAMDPAIRSAKDLGGKIVAVQTGTSYLENVQKVATIKEMKNFPTDVDARSALVSKRVDAWVTDRFVAKEVAAKNPDAGFKLGEMVFIEQIASAVTKGTAGLADAWNKALAATMADGSYAAVSTKYFNEDVRCH